MYIFKRTYPKSGSYGAVSASVIEKYNKDLPPYLLSVWEQDGWAHYHDGFFSLCNPDTFNPILSLFMPELKGLNVFMRTAFGGMIFMDTKPLQLDPAKEGWKKVNYYDPIFRQIIPLGDDLQMVLDYWLTTDSLCAAYLHSTLYVQVRKRLDMPKKDECYGFVPALALGGDMNPDQLEIAKLKEHMTLLSNL